MRATLIIAACTLLSPGMALAQFGHDSITGHWTGYWTNSHGSEGYDRLHVREYDNGRIRGVWGEYGYPIRGRRVSPSQYVWEAWGEGSHRDRHYEVTATLAPDGSYLHVRYNVTYREDGEWRQYWGRSKLRRA